MITKTPIDHLTHEQWLEERAKSIGGSEMGTIMGMNPFQSAYNLFMQRTGKIPAFEGNMPTKVGTALEQFVAQEFSERSGIRVFKSGYMYRNDRFLHMHASPDRLIHKGLNGRSPIVGGLECKTTSEFNMGKFKGKDFPIQYLCQCVAYMAVLDVEYWYLAVLIGNHDFKIYKVERERFAPVGEPVLQEPWLDGTITVDEDDIASLRTAADSFWECLEKGIAPLPDGSESTSKAIDAQYPTGETKKTVNLNMYELDVLQILEIKAQIKELEKKADQITNGIKVAMEDAEIGQCGEHKVTWKNSVRSTLDSKKLKEELPDIAARYTKVSEVRTFSVK